MPRVYVASPFGFSVATKGYYDEHVLRPLRSAGIEPLDPWDEPLANHEFEHAKAMPLGQKRLDLMRRIDERLGARNAKLIEESAGMLAILDGVDVDSGTAAEVGFGSAMGKPIVGLRLDIRLTGDNEGTTVNLQVEHFIRASRGEIVRSVEEAVALLAGRLRES